jgi:hypothetical protein
MKRYVLLAIIIGCIISCVCLFGLWMWLSTPNPNEWIDEWLVASKRIAFETSFDVDLDGGPTGITPIMGGYLFTGVGSVNFFYKDYYSFIYYIKVQNGIVSYCRIYMN